MSMLKHLTRGGSQGNLSAGLRLRMGTAAGETKEKPRSVPSGATHQHLLGLAVFPGEHGCVLRIGPRPAILLQAAGLGRLRGLLGGQHPAGEEGGGQERPGPPTLHCEVSLRDSSLSRPSVPTVTKLTPGKGQLRVRSHRQRGPKRPHTASPWQPRETASTPGKWAPSAVAHMIRGVSQGNLGAQLLHRPR